MPPRTSCIFASIEKSLSFPRFHPFELARETFREKRLGPCPLWLRVG
jgi:hypothetical protein